MIERSSDQVELLICGIVELLSFLSAKADRNDLIVKINFDLQTVWIRFVGTHLQYDGIDVLTI